MRARAAAQRLVDSPLLNGVVTLAVIGIAVYLSYTANNGLPFAPTYRIAADVPSAGQLVRHADVRIGGARGGPGPSIEAIPAHGEGGAPPPPQPPLSKRGGQTPAGSP